MKFDKIFINFAIFGLLVFAIISFGVQLQVDNNAPEQILDNVLLNGTYNSLQSDLGNYRNQSQTQRQLFEEENPTVTFGSLILFSIVSSGKVFTSMTIGVFNTLIKLPMTLFGVDPVVSSILGTILIVSIIIGLWSLYKLGG